MVEVEAPFRDVLLFAWVGARNSDLTVLNLHDKKQLDGRVEDWLIDRNITELVSYNQLANKALGLVCLEFIDASASVLKRRTTEQRLFGQLLGGLANCIHYKVKHSCFINNSIQQTHHDAPERSVFYIALGENMNLAHYDAVALNENSAGRLLDLQVAGMAAPTTVRQEFEAWCDLYNLIQEPIPTTLLFIPHPICLLMCDHTWESCCLSWSRQFHSRCRHLAYRQMLQSLKQELQEVFIDDSADQNEEEQLPPPPANVVCGRGAFLEIADHIKVLSEIASQHCDTEESAHQLLDTTTLWLNWLSSLCEAQSSEEFNRRAWLKTQVRGSHWSPLVGAHGKYSSDFLIACLRVALGSVLFSGQKGAALRSRMLRVASCLPQSLATVLKDQLEHAQIPSDATMSRRKLYLDTAFMCEKRADFHEGSERGDIYILLIDASPLSHDNILMFEHWAINGLMLDSAGT